MSQNTVMAATSTANYVTLKRPYAIDFSSQLSSNAFVTTTGALELPQQLPRLTTPTRPRLPERRRKFILHSKSKTWPHDRTMPVQMSSQSFTDSFSTLSPIYDQDLPSATSQSNEPTRPSTSYATDRVIISNASLSSTSHSTSATQQQQHPYFFHRDSFSTSASGSSCSSPTTTASLADLVSQDTPGTSPDTPASSQSLSYPSLSLALRAAPDGKPDWARVNSLVPPSNKRPRNLKNLAVNTSNTLSIGRAASTAALPVDMASRISPSFPSPQRSATFVKPMQPPPRRKGSALGLTIKTPSSATHPPSSLAPLHALDRPAVPPTPSLVRPTALRSFQSSPSLPLLTSKFPPERGMRLPSFSNHNTDITHAFPAGFADVPAERDEDEESLNFDIPQSREEKPDAYPDGPICIYDPHVYLYFEPTVEQASGFDVIFNVASEVKNPFLAADSEDSRVSRSLEQLMDELNNTTSTTTNSSSSTPKQAVDIEDPLAKKTSITEYIHIPWEHNTDIVPDLHKLVKIVDERVQSGKKVLIHCQCGVSRSASLIVAYGLYKRPMITVQEAYDAVKKRSKWIGPNMNLIMQLQEFRSGLLRGGSGSLGLRGQQAPAHSNTASDSGMPRTAPLLPGTGKIIPRPISTDGLGQVAPGPSSAPSGLQWPSMKPAESSTPDSATNSTPTTTTTTATNHAAKMLIAESSYVDATGNVVSPSAVALSEPSPMKASSKELASLSLTSSPSLNAHMRSAAPPPLSFARAMSIPSPVESPRSADFGMTAFTPPAADETFGITSPRNTNLDSSSPTMSQSADLDSLSSPRSTAFGMTPFQPPEADDTLTLGLTSPRTTNFGATSILEAAFEKTAPPPTPPLPAHPPPPIPTAQAATKFTAILPSPESLQSSLHVQARAELRSQLGLSSKTSHTNMRNTFATSLRSENSKLDSHGNQHLQPSVPPIPQPLQSIPDDDTPSSPLSTSATAITNVVSESPSSPASSSTSPPSSIAHDHHTKPTAISLPLHNGAASIPEDGLAEALMSPRATEFTSNPFRTALTSDSTSGHTEIGWQSNKVGGVQTGANSLNGGNETTKALDHDPRSPPQKGQNPIMRSIFDAFAT